MPCTVREMIQSDMDEVYEMFVDLYDHLNEKGFAFTLNKKFLRDSIESSLSSKFLKIFVVEYEDKVSGFIHVSITKINSKYIYEHGKFNATITELFVKDGFRSKHFGKALVMKALEHFKNNEINFIQVNTTVSNVKAIDFYKKIGFKEDYISFKYERNFDQ